MASKIAITPKLKEALAARSVHIYECGAYAGYCRGLKDATAAIAEATRNDDGSICEAARARAQARMDTLVSEYRKWEAELFEDVAGGETCSVTKID